VNFNFLEIPDPKSPNTEPSGLKLTYFYLLIPIFVLFGILVVVLLTFGRKKLNAHYAGRNGIAQSMEFTDDDARDSSAQKYELVTNRPRTTFADDENNSSFSSSSE
jgi:hypothetical protein